MLSDGPTPNATVRQSSSAPVTRVALGLGIAVPFLSYGTQIIAAPFCPGYSFRAQAASLLGSDLSMIPIMSGSTGIDTRPYSGLLQRIFAFTVFPPIAACASFLAGRIGKVSR
jgi:hypothetical protein